MGKESEPFFKEAFVWSIPNFSELKGEYTSSPKFDYYGVACESLSEGFPFRFRDRFLAVYLKAMRGGQEGFLGLALSGKGTPGVTETEGNFVYVTVGNKVKKRHSTPQGKHIIDDKTSWVWPDFLSLESLHDPVNGYLVEDTLEFRLHFKDIPHEEELVLRDQSPIAEQESTEGTAVVTKLEGAADNPPRTPPPLKNPTYAMVTLINKQGACHINGLYPEDPVLDSSVMHVMIGYNFTKRLGIILTPAMLKNGSQYVTASGATEMSLGPTEKKYPITIGENTNHPTTVYVNLHLSLSKEFDLLLGNEFLAPIGGYSEPGEPREPAEPARFFYHPDWRDKGSSYSSHPIRVKDIPHRFSHGKK